MFRRLLCVAATALVFVPLARADGPVIGATQGWLGVAAPTIGERFVTVSWKGQTTLEAISTGDGAVYGYVSFRGVWGIPAVTYDGSTAGISADARVLVLEDGFGRSAILRKKSSFLVVNARTMVPKRVVTLRGDFLVDAVSPDGSMLYLIQHVTQSDLTRYVVRAYDLRAGHLLPRAIADRAQRGWVMRGYPLKRVVSVGGDRVYTLYENDGGYPFVHALDTLHATAYCIGLPWHGSQNELWNLRLTLRDDGTRLALRRTNGKTWLNLDTRTYRLSYPLTHSQRSVRWWWLLLRHAAVST